MDESCKAFRSISGRRFLWFSGMVCASPDEGVAATRRLLPQAAVDLLNLPALDETVPMTVCMLVNERSKQGRISWRYIAAAELFAGIFGALADWLIEVMYGCFLLMYQIFGRNAFANETITTYEYVAARAFGAFEYSPGGRNGRPKLVYFRLQSRLIHGLLYCRAVPVAGNESSTALGEEAVENAMLAYRDHKTVCGLSKAGIQASTALKSAGFKVVDVDYALRVIESPRNMRITHRAYLIPAKSPPTEYECGVCARMRTAECLPGKEGGLHRRPILLGAVEYLGYS